MACNTDYTNSPWYRWLERAADGIDVPYSDPSINVTSGWEIINVPAYEPPDINSLTIGSNPPKVPNIPFGSVDAPYQAPGGTITPPDAGLAPVLDAIPPNIYEPTKPGNLDATRPGDVPTVRDPTIPDAPIIVLPDVPNVSDVLLPDAIELNIPLWDLELPTADLPIPENTFNFSEALYSSEVLTETTSEILRMLNGGVGIPDAVWQQIFEKGADLEERNGSKLIEEATTDWAARGWASPGGLLDKRIREARQSVNNARNTLARDVTIKRADAELENLKYAIAQGIALEGMLIQLHNSIQDRAIRAAEIEMQIEIQIINARIAIFNTDLAAYQTASEVFKTLVESEVARLEGVRLEIESAGLQIDIDKNRIQVYLGEIQGLSLAIDLHNSQIEGVKAIVEVDKTRVDAYESQVRSYGEIVRAWATEWDGYKAVMDGQKVKGDIYESEVRAFSANTGAYKTRVDAEGIRVSAESEILRLNISRMNADVGRYSAQVQYEVGKSAATADVYKTIMTGYQAQASYVASQARAYEAELNAHVASARASATAGIEGARVSAAQSDAIGRANVAAQETVARVTAQMAASQYGQYNYRLSASGNVNESLSYDCA